MEAQLKPHPLKDAFVRADPSASDPSPSRAQLFCFMILGGSQSDIEVLPLEAPVARWDQQARRRSSEAIRQAAGLKSGGKATVERGDPSTYMRMPAGSISEVAGQFCVGKAKCYHAKDRERLLAAIEAAYGDSAPFDEATPTHPPTPQQQQLLERPASSACAGSVCNHTSSSAGGARPSQYQLQLQPTPLLEFLHRTVLLHPAVECGVIRQPETNGIPSQCFRLLLLLALVSQN